MRIATKKNRFSHYTSFQLEVVEISIVFVSYPSNKIGTCNFASYFKNAKNLRAMKMCTLILNLDIT